MSVSGRSHHSKQADADAGRRRRRTIALRGASGPDHVGTVDRGRPAFPVLRWA